MLGSLPRLPFPASPLTVWAVEATSVQLAWGELAEGPIRVDALAGGETVSTVSIEHGGGPGVLDVDGLSPATEYRFVLTTASGTVDQTASTLRPPPGAELYRFATISDLHLGSDHFGVSKRMVERGDGREPFALRSARTAVDQALAWGASDLVIKGDAAHHGRRADFEMVGALVDRFPDLPIALLPGNHDVDQRDVPLPATVGRREVPFEPGVSHLDRPGIRLVLGDTTIRGAGAGTLRRIGDELVEAAASSPEPVVVLVHQQLQRHDPVRHWPPGVPGRESDGFLSRLASANPNALVTSGHTHRNRARRHATPNGDVLVTEVAATHHWPGVWAGYVVYEGGVTQVVRRIGGDVIGWHEYSKNAVLSVWQHYAPGRRRDRCLSLRWTDRSTDRSRDRG